jgi:O-antigen/teichoic acid export membrane protein
VNAVTGPVGYVLTLTGHQKTVAWVYAISATLDIAALAIVTPRYGFVGAAAASSCAIALANLWLYAVVRARFGFRLFGSV